MKQSIYICLHLIFPRLANDKQIKLIPKMGYTS